MRHRLAAGLGLLLLGFVLTRCAYETRTVEVPIYFDVDLSFPVDTSFVNTSVTVDFVKEFEAVETENEFFLPIEAGMRDWFWGAFTVTAGDSALLDASITVHRVASGDSAVFFSVSGLLPASVAESYVPFVPDPPGTALLQSGFEEYVAARGRGSGPPDLKYRFALRANVSAEPDFHWRVRIKVLLVGRAVGKIRT